MKTNEFFSFFYSFFFCIWPRPKLAFVHRCRENTKTDALKFTEKKGEGKCKQFIIYHSFLWILGSLRCVHKSVFLVFCICICKWNFKFIVLFYICFRLHSYNLLNKGGFLFVNELNLLWSSLFRYCTTKRMPYDLTLALGSSK